MSTEAMKRARDALGLYARTLAPTETQKKGMEAITAFDEALAQPQQKPVAWMHEWEDGEKIPMLKGRDDRNQDKPKTVRPLVYGDTSPQPAQPQQEPLSFNCSAGCGACSVKLQDFVTHQTQAQEGDPWVVVDYVPKIVSACCGSPVEVWDTRKQDVTASVEALAEQPAPVRDEWGPGPHEVHSLPAPQPAQRKPLTDEEIETVWRSVQANDFHDCVKPFARAVEAAHGIKGEA